ncbi:Transmembrane protein 230 [Lemmus lemmus]
MSSIMTNCLLLTDYISHVRTSLAIVILIVGILVFVPRCYHLIIICRSCRGCQSYSYTDLPDRGLAHNSRKGAYRWD